VDTIDHHEIKEIGGIGIGAIEIGAIGIETIEIEVTDLRIETETEADVIGVDETEEIGRGTGRGTVVGGIDPEIETDIDTGPVKTVIVGVGVEGRRMSVGIGRVVELMQERVEEERSAMEPSDVRPADGTLAPPGRTTNPLQLERLTTLLQHQEERLPRHPGIIRGSRLVILAELREFHHQGHLLVDHRISSTECPQVSFPVDLKVNTPVYRRHQVSMVYLHQVSLVVYLHQVSLVGHHHQVRTAGHRIMAQMDRIVTDLDKMKRQWGDLDRVGVFHHLEWEAPTVKWVGQMVRWVVHQIWLAVLIT